MAMKILLSIAVVFAPLLSWSQAQSRCSSIALLGEVHVVEGDVSLADLLAPGTCPAIWRAASQIRIGSAPLAGSPRVLARSEAEALLSRLPFMIPADRIRVPERVVIQRAGAVRVAKVRRDPERDFSQRGMPLVRRGEAVTLSWNSGGIHLRVPAISLDPGGAGDAVRARLGSGRILRAIVVDHGMLLSAS